MTLFPGEWICPSSYRNGDGEGDHLAPVVQSLGWIQTKRNFAIGVRRSDTASLRRLFREEAAPAVRTYLTLDQLTGMWRPEVAAMIAVLAFVWVVLIFGGLFVCF